VIHKMSLAHTLSSSSSTHSNSYELESMKNKIENMTKTHHIEILKIIKKNPTIKLNENKSGVFINISLLPADTLDEIREYLNYIEVQDESIMSVERMKEEYANMLSHQR
jgi:hypothetical protein